MARVSTKARIVAVLAWLAPSSVAGCVGAIVAGLVESRGEHVLLATGLIALLALPVLVLGSVIARGLYAAWVPSKLVESMREDRGAMPRLAAWVGVVWLATLGLAWAMFQGTWLLASWTAFKPNSISLLASALAVLAIVVIVALSRPAADLFTWLARKIDRGWQRFAPGSLLRPPIIFAGAALSAAGVGYVIWALLITRRLPDWSPGFLLGPTAAIGATLGVHALWRGPRLARAIAGGLVTAGTIAVLVLGLRAVRDQPAASLALWAESSLARIAIEGVFDVEDLRTELPLDRLTPKARDSIHPDIVLITLDGVRADRLPPYGGAAPMATLADLGQRGTVFKLALAPSASLRRSLPSILVGVSPHRLRGVGSETAFKIDPRHVGVAERLRAAGYDTAAFVEGLDDLGPDARTWRRGFGHVQSDTEAIRIAYAAREHARARTQSGPLFLWVHLRVPWPAHRDALPANQRLPTYDRALTSLDKALAEVIAAFSSRTPETAPIVVVAGVRGEELGEHGQAFSSDNLYNTQLHVPLVIAGPRIKPQLVPDTVALVDLVPSLVELAGYAPPRGISIDGQSFAMTVTGGRISASNLAFSAILPDRGPLAQMSIVRVNWKLIDAGGTIELYDLRTDPDERVNLASQRMQIVNELRALLTSRVRGANVSPF